MKGTIVLFSFGLWLLWMYWRDSKERPSVSPGIWVVVAWVFVHASRPVSMWLGVEVQTSRDEGNPTEALSNLILILLGLFLLFRKRVDWSLVFKQNGWLVAFYVFWSLSILWSDYPLITFKRLFKDVGNVVMVLLILAERDSRDAIKAVCLRVAYISVPLSVIFIKYFPNLGRVFVGHHRDTLTYIGVSTNKNALGALVMVSALVVLWDLLEAKKPIRRNADKLFYWSRASVLAYCWYLLLMINSVTSLICAGIGTALLLALQHRALRRHPARVEGIGVVGFMFFYVIDWAFNVTEMALAQLGRNVTLTSRTDIWTIVQDVQTNPLLGMGFDTFWAGTRMQVLEDRIGVGIIQAHNGYLETYLNGGFVGVGLLAAVLFVTYRRVRSRLKRSGASIDAMRMTLLLTALIHNYTEASFNKLGVLWFVTAFAILEYDRIHRFQARPSQPLPS